MERLYDCEQIQKVYEPAVEYTEGKLELLKMAVITTHRCTLACKLCAERTPYYRERYHPSLELLKEQMTEYFKVVDYTMKLDISGGEPLVRTDLPEFFLFLLSFKKQFGRVRLVTNGTIKMSEELCGVFKAYGKQLDVLIDCYANGGKLLSIHAEENEKLLREHGVRCILRKQSEEDRHINGWIDFGKLTEERTEAEGEIHFGTCAIYNKIGGGLRIKDGVIMPCAITKQLADFGIREPEEDEYCNLLDEKLSVAEKQKKIEQMFHLKMLSSCRYCNGMSEKSERFDPAEQLTGEERERAYEMYGTHNCV